MLQNLSEKSAEITIPLVYLREAAPPDTVYYDTKTYNSGELKPDGKVYRTITVENNVTVEAGQSPQLKANESITLKQNFHAKAGSGFHAKWVQEPNYEIKDDNAAFRYDKIGNLISDSSEGTKISWTPYGKVRQVSKSNGDQVTYRYDGQGNRVEKKVVASDSSFVTRYIRDASGNVLAIYQDSVLSEQPIYGSSRLGMYRGGTEAGKETLGNRRFELGNHLGNVLAVITDNINMNQDSTWATVESLQDYFAFGMEMKERSWQSITYRHDFNGKETDLETGWQDYGMRQYMKKYGRFPSVDPLTKQYPELTPYQFASNTPVQAIDLDGLEAKVVIYQNADESGYQPIFQITQQEDLNGQTRVNLRQDYPGLPKEGAVNIYLGREGDFERFEQDRWYQARQAGSEIGKGFKEAGALWGEFFDGQTEDARVGRGIVGGIVGLGLSIPSAGSSLTIFGSVELGFSVNELLSGIVDAGDKGSKTRNLFSEGSEYLGGEIGSEIYNYVETGVSAIGIGANIYKGYHSLKNKNISEALKESVGVAKGTNDLLNKLEDEEKK